MHPSDHVRCPWAAAALCMAGKGAHWPTTEKAGCEVAWGGGVACVVPPPLPVPVPPPPLPVLMGWEWGEKNLQQRLRNLFAAGGREGGPTIALGGVNASTLSRSLKHSFGFPYLLGSRLFACVAAIPLRNHKIPRVLAQDAPPKVIVSQ